MVGNSVSWTSGRSSTFGLKRSGDVRACSVSASSGERALAGNELIALPADGPPRAVEPAVRPDGRPCCEAPREPSCEHEERDAVGLWHHLWLMPAVRQRIARRLGERRGAAGGAELAREEVSDERLGRGIGRVVDDQPVRPEQRLEPPREGVSHANARPVGGAKRREEPFGELASRRAPRRARRGSARRGHRGRSEATDRSPAPSGFGKRDRVRLEARIEHRTARDLLPVMILGIDPENGHDIGVLLARRPAGELDGGDGFQQREERAAEGARLLAGEDRDRVGVGEFLSGLACGWRGAPPSLLDGKDTGDGRIRSSHRARPRDRVGPRLMRRRISGVERRDLGEVECVVARERPDPAEAAHVDRSAGRAVGERRFR